MTPEQAKRLSRIIWQERLRKWGPTVLGCAVVAVGMAYLMGEKLASFDTVVASSIVHAQVTDTARLIGRRSGFLVHARLDDGREIEATSQLSQQPIKGEQAEIRAAKHSSGHMTYDVVRLLD